MRADPKCWVCGVMVHPTGAYNPLRCEECNEKYMIKKKRESEMKFEGANTSPDLDQPPYSPIYKRLRHMECSFCGQPFGGWEDCDCSL